METKKARKVLSFMRCPQYFACIAFMLSFSTATVFAQQTGPTTPVSQSADKTTAGSRNLPHPRQEAMAQLAKSQSPDTEVMWLETQLEAFLGLYHPANSANPMGAALILPHDRTSPDWPEMVHSIRTQLPNQSWHTLAIAMPEEPRSTVPIRAVETATPAPDSSAQAEPDSYKEKVFERIDAGLNAAKEKIKGSERLLIIGIGTGGYWASRYLKDKQPAASTLLVLIDARPPLGESTPTIAEAVASITIPTADLLHSAVFDKQYMDHLAVQRKNQAKRDARPFYLQRNIPGRPSAGQGTDRVLVNTLRGIIEERLLKMIPEVFLKGKDKPGNMKPG